ncbi:cold shock protein [Pseudoalteromonas phage pYD6-A]|uniref:CSD domain-containing protein n=1 Tax=Pseudoalteromonas phage pYD6-A TaxID=754052 RepID=M4SRZ2_9CAUD|nr:cold shock protein [Pseudoalteromonas phage pYD6-A]AGH57576.1 hypothetical protein PYDG_00045 [Pseudoalteromonas phage pYD6-A]
MNTQLTAKVTWFSKVKGFGFATAEGVEGDIMVHQSVIAMDGYRFLKPNQEITIEGTEKTERGLRASKIIV